MFRLFLYESNRRCLISVRPRPPLTDIFEDVRSGRPELRGGESSSWNIVAANNILLYFQPYSIGRETVREQMKT